MKVVAEKPKSKTYIASVAILFWLPVLVFIGIVGEIIKYKPVTFDISILNLIHAHSTPFLDSFFLFVTTVGNFVIMAPLSLVAIGFLYYKKHYRSAKVVALSVVGAAIANLLLKMLFHRVRPHLWHSAVTLTSYSFPSGHAMASAALMFSLIFIAWKTSYRWVVTPLAVLAILLIGISRLYLGVHYPTDVIAGWCVSLAC